jgi:hypothetical protein
VVADIALKDCVLLLLTSLSGSVLILIARSWSFRPSTIKLRYRVCRHHNDIDASQHSTESEFSPCSIYTVSWSGYGKPKKKKRKIFDYDLEPHVRTATAKPVASQG